MRLYASFCFYVIKASQGVYAGSVTDDINGSSNRNATLTINLTAGDVYYLVAFDRSSAHGFTLRIDSNP